MFSSTLALSASPTVAINCWTDDVPAKALTKQQAAKKRAGKAYIAGYWIEIAG